MKRFVALFAIVVVLILIGVIILMFPKLGGLRSYSVTIPKLSGGVNTSEAPHLINDNQLTDSLNMWWERGALRSRPGLWTGEDEIHDRYMRKSAELSSDLVDMSLYVYPIANKYYINRYARYQSASRASAEARVCIFDEHGYFDDFAGGIGIVNLSPDIPDFTMLLIPVNSSATNTLSQYGAIAFTSPSDVYGVAPGVFEDLSDRVYIPAVMINGTPSETELELAVSGTINEAYNLLTPKYKCTYTSGPPGKYYALPMKNVQSEVKVRYTNVLGILEEFTIEVGDDRSYTSGYNVRINRTGGYVWFESGTGIPIALPDAGIRNNIEIIAELPSSTAEKNKEKICGMTLNTWYGGDASGLRGGTRLFVSGNPEYPNLVHWSDVNNPLYFPEGNFKYVGGDSQRVTGFGKQGGMLIVFKEKETYRFGIETAEVTTQAVEAGIAVTNDYVFTVVPINSYIGCDVPNTIQLCSNNLVWMNTNGKVYTLVSANQYNENTIKEVSLNIESKIKEHTAEELKNASAADYDGRYYLLIGNKIYVQDYRNSPFVYYGSYVDDKKAQRGMEWYIWDVAIKGITWHRILGEGTKPVMCGSYFDESDNLVMINYVFSGRDDTSPDGSSAPVNCMFQTKVFDFGNPSTFKNIGQMYLGVGRESTEAVLRISYLTDRGVVQDAYSLHPIKEPAGEGTSEYIDVRKITPRLNRILRFGIRVEADAAMAVDSMMLKYTPYGGVR